MSATRNSLDALVVSCCARPDWTLKQSLDAYAALGYRRLECFVDWVSAALDPTAAPESYRAMAEACGMTYYSLHLPHFDDADLDGSLARAVAAARFASTLGMTVVYPRARSLEALIRLGRPFLDATDGMGLTACLEIHKNTPVHDIASLQTVLDGISGDERIKGVLEVGHLHKAGETWRQAWGAFGERLAVVHLKDIRDDRNTPLGTGECDLPGLLGFLAEVRYCGDFVVELLLPETSADTTVCHLANARSFYHEHFRPEPERYLAS